MQSLNQPWPLNPSTGEARENVLSGGVHGFGMLPSLNTAALAAVIATELTQGAAICSKITELTSYQRAQNLHTQAPNIPMQRSVVDELSTFTSSHLKWIFQRLLMKNEHKNKKTFCTQKINPARRRVGILLPSVTVMIFRAGRYMASPSTYF